MKNNQLASTANPGGALSQRFSTTANHVGKSLGVCVGNVQALLACLMLMGAGLAATTQTAAAAAVSLAWNANPETNITGYKVSYGTTSGVYSNVASVGTSPTTSISGLVEGVTYYFAVAAVNQDGLQSPLSSQISYQVPTTVPTNQPPVALAASVSTNEDTSLAIILKGTDPEKSSLTYSTVSNPSKGVLSGTAPNVTYTPAANFNGSDSFTFRVRDGALDSTIATISISVTPINDAPVAQAKSVTTAEDIPLTITLTGTDAENSPLTYTTVSTPTNGTLSGTPPNLTYSPSANFNGSDSFTFRVGDGALNSTSATISISVTPANDAPVAQAKSVTTAEDAPVTITLTGTDVENSPLTFSIVGNPVNGILSGTPPNLTYSPAANFNGNDSFTFRVRDGALNSATSTISISVTPVNDAPVAVSKTVSTTEGTPLSIILNGSDAELNNLTFKVITQPTSGTLTGTAPNLTYSPVPNFNGSDKFTFQTNDGTASSTLATISINVTSTNDAPIALAATVSTSEDTSVAITLTGTDPENSPLSYTKVSGPTNGSLSGTAPNLTYTPSADFNGNDSFTFRVNDGTLDSAVATIAITVTPLNDAPLAIAKSVTTPEDTQVPIVLTGSDKDSNNLTFSVATAPANGTLTGTPPNLTYLPAPNSSGSDQFTFRVRDGSLDSTPATVFISVTSVNDAPVALGGSAATTEDTPVTITLAGTDLENSPLTFSIISNPAKGLLSGTPPNLTYSPSADSNGSDSFTFRVRDGVLYSATATISISVTPVNDAPVAVSKTVATTEDTPLPIILTGSDKESNNLTFKVVAAPANGALTGTPPNLTYTPAENFNGSDKFTFQANDGTANSTVATISINITSTIDVPVALANSVTTAEDTAVPVILAGTQTDGTSLAFTTVEGPSHGALSGTAPNLTYLPAANFNGTDSFTFLVNDGTMNSLPATISITINPVNDAPVAKPFALETLQSAPVALVLTGNDPDGTTPTFTVINSPANGQLSGSAPNLTYSPNAGHTGIDQFTFRAGDGILTSSLATVTITITPVNQTTGNLNPTFPAAVFQATEDAPLSGQLVASDGNPGDTLTFTKVSGPSWLTVSTSGALGGIPLNTDVGTSSVSVRVTDQAGASADATIIVSVANVNDAPAFVSNPVLAADATESVAYTGQSLAGNTIDSDVGDSLTYSKVSGPEWLSIAPTGELSGTPSKGSTGLNAFVIRVSDSATFADAELRINVAGLPLPWTSLDLGTGQLAGSATYAAGTFALSGSGALGGNSDRLQFTYQTLVGDGQITARISSRKQSGGLPPVGVMIRDTLASNSRQVFLGLQGADSFRLIRRTFTGARNTATYGGNGNPPNAWVRLVRRGTVVTSFKSNDGTNWTAAGSTTVRLGAVCYIGLAVSSGSNSTLNTAEFSNVRVVSAAAAVRPLKEPLLRLDR